MSLLTTSAASIHQLAAAAALAGPPPAPDEVNASAARGAAGETRACWSLYEAVTNALLTAGWVIEQHKLREKGLDRPTNVRVAIKDACVAGAMLTNIANIVADKMMNRDFPQGIGTVCADASTPAGVRAARYRTYFKVAKLVNRLCVAGAIGFTPLVNFKILDSYRPGTLYRLFT